MLHQQRSSRIGHRSILFNATTTDYSYGAINAFHNSDLPTTYLALIRPTGAGEGNFGYIASKTIASSATGFRFMVDHNTGSPRIVVGYASGNTGPQRSSPAGSITYGKWTWVAFTFATGLAAANIAILIGEKSVQEVTSYSAFTDGTGSFSNDATLNFHIGNREGGDRTFAGDIAMLVRWNTVLQRSEINRAIQTGPASYAREHQLLCWVAGVDVGPNALRASSIAGNAFGRSTPYRVSNYLRELFPLEASSLSAVQKDSDLRWDVIAAAMKDANFRWDVLNSATKDADLRWALLNAAQKDADFRWDIVSALQKDVDLRWDLVSAILKDVDIRWDIQSSSTVIKDVDLRWSLLSSLLKDADFRWNVLQAVQKDSSLIWNLLAGISKDVDLRWDVLSSLTSITKDVDLRWSLVASAIKDLSAQWNVLTSVSKDETLIWNIAVAAVRDIDLRWDIAAGLGAVTKDATFMWAIMNAPQKDITLQWVIQTVSGPEIRSRYIYVLPEEGRVFVLRPENFH